MVLVVLRVPVFAVSYFRCLHASCTGYALPRITPCAGFVFAATFCRLFRILYPSAKPLLMKPELEVGGWRMEFEG